MSVGEVIAGRTSMAFDLDGTLVDTLADQCAALNRALAGQGLAPVTIELVRQSLHEGLEGSVDAALRGLPDAQRIRPAVLAAFARHYEHSLVVRSSVYPGASQVLQTLRARGTRLAVCTNKQRAQAIEILGALDLLRFFDVVVGADSFVHRKPHPMPLLRALAALDGLPSDSLMVGDSPVDQRCAAAASVTCLLFRGGYADPEWLDACGTVSFRDYAELMRELSSAPGGWRPGGLVNRLGVS